MWVVVCYYGDYVDDGDVCWCGEMRVVYVWEWGVSPDVVQCVGELVCWYDV